MNGCHISLSLRRGGFGEDRMAEDGNSGGWERGSPEVGTVEERGVPHCKLTQPQDPLTSTSKEEAPAGGGKGSCISTRSCSICRQSSFGEKKLREDTDEDEGSGFNLGKVVQAAENFPARGSSRQSPALQGVGSGVAMHVTLSLCFWALHPFPWLLWERPLLPHLPCCD